MSQNDNPTCPFAFVFRSRAIREADHVVRAVATSDVALTLIGESVTPFPRLRGRTE